MIATTATNARAFSLKRKGDQVVLRFADDEKELPVKLTWARPITARGRDISLFGYDKKEVLMVKDLEAFEPESRRIAEEELGKRYVAPRILRVLAAKASFGIRYWQVETDLGPRHFALKNASKNAVWVNEDHLVLRDTLGCRYDIQPYSALDPRSQMQIERVI